MSKTILMIQPCVFNGTEGTASRRIKTFLHALTERDFIPVMVSYYQLPQEAPTQVASWGVKCRPYIFPIRRKLLPGRIGDLCERIFRKLLPWSCRSNPLHLYERYLKEALKVADECKPVAVLASYPAWDITSMRVAKQVSVLRDIPLILDFRDVPGEHGELSQKDDIDARECIQEACKNAAYISCLDPGGQQYLQEISGRNDVVLIQNGYDETVNSIEATLPQRSDRFVMVYPGVLYDISMDMDYLWSVLDKVAGQIGAVDDFRVDFYLVHGEASSPSLVTYMKSGRPGSGYVSVLGKRPHEEILDIERSSAVLLTLTFQKAKTELLPSKIYEYLPMRRPILNIPRSGELTEKILKSTGYFEPLNSEDEVAAWLASYYEEWKNNEGCLRRVAIQKDAVECYSRQKLSARWADGVIASINA